MRKRARPSLGMDSGTARTLFRRGQRPVAASGTVMLMQVDREQLGVLRRALEARVRDMQLRLGSEPGDEGYRREARLSTQLLRLVEDLERGARHRTSRRRDGDLSPTDAED
jgi:hypothetical protein